MPRRRHRPSGLTNVAARSMPADHGLVSRRARRLVGLRPDVADGPGHAAADVLDFAFRDFFGQQLKHGDDGLGRLFERIAREVFIDAIQELLDVPALYRRCGRPPLLVIGAAQKARQLGAEVDGFFDPQ